MKGVLFYATIAHFSLGPLGCVSHYRASSVKSPDYNYRMHSPFSSYPKVLLEAPTTKYVVVGTIEVRAARSASVDELISALVGEAFNLSADAVIPPSPDFPRNLKFQSLNPHE